jgi:hypothetical protein
MTAYGTATVTCRRARSPWRRTMTVLGGHRISWGGEPRVGSGQPLSAGAGAGRLSVVQRLSELCLEPGHSTAHGGHGR